MRQVYITDYVKDPDIEAEVLGNRLANNLSRDIEVLLVWHQKVNKEYVSQFPNLRGVVRYGVGYDNIDVSELSARGIIFCNTPDYGIDEVSDTAITMIMVFHRGVMHYDIECRQYKTGWQENTLPHLTRTNRNTVGIIGAGRIGSALMLKARMLGFNIAFYDPYVPEGYDKVMRARSMSCLTELLSISDYVSIHTPLTEETRAMVNREFIASMKPGAVLINTARGAILEDDQHLLDGLVSGRLGAVGLDVLPQEPPIETPFIKAWRNHTALAKRIIINPHAAYFTNEAYREMRRLAATNAKRILNRERPKNIIGP